MVGNQEAAALIWGFGMQVVRSMASWSGASRHEASLYGAWIDLILKSEHYVYIEQQFFVSANTGGGVSCQPDVAVYCLLMTVLRWYCVVGSSTLWCSLMALCQVSNQVGKALMQRLERAIVNEETFRLIVIFPFPEETGAGARALMQWQYGTISRGGHSLLEQLNTKYPDIKVTLLPPQQMKGTSILQSRVTEFSCSLVASACSTDLDLTSCSCSD